MRVLNIVFCLLMLLFGAVQYNDPDGSRWLLIYFVPAFFCGIAGFKPDWLMPVAMRALLLLALLLALIGVFYYWPQMDGFWRRDVWWEEETAREGMGMMIVALALLLAWFGVLTVNRRKAVSD